MKSRLFTILLFAFVLVTNQTRAGVPAYSSYPSATAVLFLDFDGHTVTGTAFNFNQTHLYCANAGLTDEQITKVYNRVAEDYRPFNLNITTDSTVFLAAPLNRRMRVIITTTWEWYGAAGGVALPGSFTWGNDSPCFVFSNKLNFNLKAIAEAASHEAGHTLGLSHQAAYTENCQIISPYYGGRGSGEIGWAPIMGVGYYQNTTQWYNGPDPTGCSNFQDDLTIITAGNGFTFRTDDHGNTNTTATAVSFSNGQFTVQGVVEKSTDADVIKFILAENSHLQISANPFNVGTGNSGANIDLQLSIASASNTIVNVYNPGNLLNSSIDTTLPAGTYYLRVEGKGNMYAPGYASLGSYTLQGNLLSGDVLPLRVLKLDGKAVGDKHRLQWMIDADEQVTEQVLEVSAGGSSFIPAALPGAQDRSHVYTPTVNGNAQYRLRVSFSNGKQYYSNIVLIRASGQEERPKLVSTLANSQQVTVTSPFPFRYRVYDMNGKSISGGELTGGYHTISTAGARSGMYIVKFAANNEEWADKLILR